MKVYSFLPLEERKLTVIVIGSEPISWAKAYKEIKEKTPLGDRILKKLIEKGLV